MPKVPLPGAEFCSNSGQNVPKSVPKFSKFCVDYESGVGSYQKSTNLENQAPEKRQKWPKVTIFKLLWHPDGKVSGKTETSI